MRKLLLIKQETEWIEWFCSVIQGVYYTRGVYQRGVYLRKGVYEIIYGSKM